MVVSIYGAVYIWCCPYMVLSIGDAAAWMLWCCFDLSLFVNIFQRLATRIMIP